MSSDAASALPKQVKSADDTTSSRNDDELSEQHAATTHAGPTSELATIVVIMTRKWSPELMKRLAHLVAVGLDAHLVLDDETSMPDTPDARVHFIDDPSLLAAGFTDLQSKTCGKKLTAWERATLWCAQQRRSLAFAWLVEDDVLWDRPDTLSSLVQGFARDPSDLVAQDLAASQASRPTWPHWNAAHGLLPSASWAASFNVICRLSSRFLSALAAFARRRGCLGFHEVLLRSLAVHHGLRVALFHDPHEALAALPPLTRGLPRMLLRYRPAFTDAELERELGMHRDGGMIFHPVKHFSSVLDHV